MADVTVDNGALTDYVVDTVELSDGSEVQTVQLVSASEGGSKTAVTIGGGVEAAALRVTVASDSTGVLSVDDNGGSLTVDGTVAVSGTVAVTQSGTWDEVGINDSGNSITVDDGGGSLTVDGSVSVSGTATVDSELPAAAALADNTSNPTAPAVGAFGHVWDGATWDRTPGTAADGVTVNLGSNNDVTVTGSVTANAGTNLNTSALALESGGNLAGAATSLAILDDWDESDRAKINPIVGQAGVAAGAGAVGATVQRVTLASDDPGVASLSVLDDWDESDRAKVNPIAGQAGVAAGSGTVSALTQRVVLATDVALPTGTNTIGAVTPLPLASGGCDTFHSNDLDETEEDVKTSAGTVYGWIITNRSTASVYVHFYNATAANVTVGTTAPLFIFAVPGNSSDDVAANLLGGIGINFSTAISVAATTDFPDDGSPAGPSTNDVLCTVFYK